MSKKLITIDEMWEILKNENPKMKVTIENAEKVVKLNNSYENFIIKQKDTRIAELEKQLAIKDRALELASDVIKVICPPIAIGGIVPEHFNDTKDSEYFIDQAKKELGEKK